MRPLHLTTLALTLAATSARQLPLVVWHGLGDTYSSDGILSLGTLANATHPGTFFHPISLDADPASDRSATFFGLVDTQLELVCAQLAAIPELAHGFNALGFSQGGQFLRGYVQRCNAPPVKTLVTFGSQHAGISEFVAECGAADWPCRAARGLLARSHWQDWVQRRVVPAQYFRDPEDMEGYLEHSAWLADVNNERAVKNATYAKNLGTLERFVMYMFTQDQTVVPKESAWFSEVVGGKEVPLREQKIYKEDWIGLRRLDEEGKLEFGEVEGEHMRFGEGVLEEVIQKYFGPSKDVEEDTEL
ncbi:Alpha/Beta hydrolase protein [Geopyxis carbonaria]|nr:Alpha/Beta hydrolase protein [Geopyxis carbonaria]